MEIQLEYIIVSMFITFMVLYTISPKKFVIYKEPSINMTESPMYIDDNSVCYKYKRIKVPCK